MATRGAGAGPAIASAKLPVLIAGGGIGGLAGGLGLSRL